MTTDAARYARDLLRIAIDLLDDEESLTAVAMISGALDVLERKAEPMMMRSTANWQHTHQKHSARVGCRSCA